MEDYTEFDDHDEAIEEDLIILLLIRTIDMNQKILTDLQEIKDTLKK